MWSEDGIATARPAMDQQENGIVSILSADRDPLIDATDSDETFFRNSQHAIDL
jgi:hypothetical protein